MAEEEGHATRTTTPFSNSLKVSARYATTTLSNTKTKLTTHTASTSVQLPTKKHLIDVIIYNCKIVPTSNEATRASNKLSLRKPNCIDTAQQVTASNHYIRRSIHITVLATTVISLFTKGQFSANKMLFR